MLDKRARDDFHSFAPLVHFSLTTVLISLTSIPGSELDLRYHRRRRKRRLRDSCHPASSQTLLLTFSEVFYLSDEGADLFCCRGEFADAAASVGGKRTVLFIWVISGTPLVDSMVMELPSRITFEGS